MRKKPNLIPGKQYINECRRLSLKHIQSQFTTYIENLIEKLFQMADKAGSNQEQESNFAIHSAIKSQQKQLLESFILHIHGAFKDYARHKPTVTAQFLDNLHQQDTLRLVDNDDLEESIALRSMSQKIENHSSEQLYTLNKRLSAVRGGSKVSTHESPVEPSVFVEAIYKTISQLDLNTKTRLIIYKVFDSQFMNGLDDLYRDLNQHLIDIGVLANLRYDNDSIASKRARTNPAGSQSTSRINNSQISENTNNSTPSNPTTGMRSNPQKSARTYKNDTTANQLFYQWQHHESSNKLQQQLLDSIMQLQEQRQAPNDNQHQQNNQSTNDNVVSLGIPYNHEDLLLSLNNIQNQQISTLDDTEAPLIIFTDLNLQLKESLKENKLTEETASTETQGEKIAQLDADLIEIVGLLFDCVLNNENLPNRAKALFSYLHTPFLKLALLDRDFFAQVDHPARQLLNTLVEAAERWLEETNRHKDVVYERMRLSVHRILNEFVSDVSLFIELNKDFSDFMHKHQHRVSITEDRSKQAATGEDKLQENRRKVTLELDQRTAGRRIPIPIVNLLYEPWANYMSFNLLRFGIESDEWNNALGVVDKIIWHIEPKHDLQGKEASNELNDSLLTSIIEGFKTVGYDAKKGDTLIKSLKLCQRLSIDDLVDGNKDPTPLPPVHEPKAVKTKVELDTSEQKILDQLLGLKPDTWFVLNQRDPDKRHLAKLSWCNHKTNRFMLVNKLGQQALSCTGAELAQAIEQGDISIYDNSNDKPFIERALTKIYDIISKPAKP